MVVFTIVVESDFFENRSADGRKVHYQRVAYIVWAIVGRSCYSSTTILNTCRVHNLSYNCKASTVVRNRRTVCAQNHIIENLGQNANLIESLDNGIVRNPVSDMIPSRRSWTKAQTDLIQSFRFPSCHWPKFLVVDQPASWPKLWTQRIGKWQIRHRHTWPGRTTRAQ